MLRTNLSTRPFYNERGLHAALSVAAIVVLLITIFNVTRVVVLARRQSEYTTRAAQAEAQSRELQNHASGVKQHLDQKQLDTLSNSAREANTLIGQRLFSWTELLNKLETTLPDDVRIASMHPIIEKSGDIRISMTVIGRRVEDINTFMENLEGTGSFSDVISNEETVTDDGMRRAVIEGRYRSR